MGVTPSATFSRQVPSQTRFQKHDLGGWIPRGDLEIRLHNVFWGSSPAGWLAGSQGSVAGGKLSNFSWKTAAVQLLTFPLVVTWSGYWWRGVCDSLEFEFRRNCIRSRLDTHGDRDKI